MKSPFFLTIVLWSLIGHSLLAQQSNPTFGQDEVLEDLTYLYNSLIDAHYDIYAYQSEAAFLKNYQNIRNSITKDSISLLEATSTFQKVISAVHNGHTEIDFPIASYRKYANDEGTIFPLEIAFENNKSLIRKNYSNNLDIKIGSEILSINGVSMTDILAKIYPQVSAERVYFKNAKIEMYSFPRYYWQVFGRQDHFEIQVRTNETIKNYIIDAINLIEAYEKQRNEVLNAQMKLKLYGKSAYLNPGNFSGDEQKFRRFIDSAFAEIKNSNSKNLIIDLRNNSGGNDSFSDYLVSYVVNKPFKWNSKFTLKTSQFLKEHTRKNSDTTQVYFQNILQHENGEIYEYDFDAYEPQPKKKRFAGNVFVLINRQSHSQSAVTAAQIQDYKFGTIVGEETGDFPSLYASQFHYTLPNTGIPVKVAKGFMVRVNGSEKREGVIPDIFIRDHLLDDNDEILYGVLNILKEKY